MATAEELWAARSADAKAFADSVVYKPKATKKTKSVDTGSLGDSVYHSPDEANKTDFWNTPVAKSVINALSVGTYTSAAAADGMMQSAQAAKDEFAKNGNVTDAIGQYLGTGLDQLVNHNPLAMGVKAGFGNDAESRRTYADVIKHGQTIDGIDSNSDASKTVQGVGGFIGDVALDPLNAIPGVFPAKIAGGIIKGGVIGAKAAKEVAAGGEALGRTVGRFAGMKQGAKDGFNAAKQESADSLAFRQAKLAINKGADPQLFADTVRGFDHLPENVLAGTAKLTNKAGRKAAFAETKIAKGIEKDTVQEAAKIAATKEFSHVRTADELAAESVRANTDLMSGAISVGKHNAIIRTMKSMAKTHGHDYAKIVEDYLVRHDLKDAAPVAAKAAESIPVAAKAAESLAPAAEKAAIPMPVGKIGEEITAKNAQVAQAKELIKNGTSLTPAFNHVTDPGALNPTDFVRDTPVDQFVKGTSHLSAEVPRMGKAAQNKVREYLTTHPGVSKSVAQQEVLDARKLQEFVLSQKLRFSTKNPEGLLNDFRQARPDGSAAGGITGFNRSELNSLIEKTLAKHEKQINHLHSTGDSAGATALTNKVVTEALKKNVYHEDLTKLIKAVKDSVVTPEVISYAWSGAKPGIKQLRDLGFKGDLRESMKTIREFGANLDKLSRKSGAFKDILEAYRKGLLPVEDMARFEEFASSFFKLEGENRLNKDKILEMASDFLQKNSDSITASSILHAPVADGGRLTTLNRARNTGIPGGESEAKALISILPPDRVATYSRPFREDERIAMVEHNAQKAEADILNGISPDFVSGLADNIIEKHFSEYSTKSGEFVTKDGWHTSTMNLADGLPKKEFFWTTHSAIDLFRKLNDGVSAHLKQVPELDALRTLRYSKPSAANIKTYETAYKNVKDNLAMRALAQVDANLKAHNVFGYLTNVMPHGDTAIRLSMYDVLDAMGPAIRQRHLWVPKGNIANIRPTQLMDVAETMIRSLKGTDAIGEIDQKLMLKNVREVLAGNFSKNANSKGIVRFIEQNLDDSNKAFNDGIIAANKELPKAESLRKAKYTQLINDIMNKVGDDGLTPLQKLADTVLRNTAMHAQQFSSKIVYATEQQMKRLGESLDNGTVGAFHEVVASIVRPDHFEPEVSKVFDSEIRAANLEHVSLDELAVAKEMQNVAHISTGKEMVLYTGKEMAPELKVPTVGKKDYTIPVGPKPKTPNMKGRIPLSEKNSTEIMLNGMRLLTDGKKASTKWSIKPWKAEAGVRFRDSINAANAKVAERSQNMALHPDQIVETVAKHEPDEYINMMRVELANDSARKLFVGQQMFNVRFGKELTYDTVTMGMHLGTALETAFHGAVNEYSRKYTLESAKQALKDIQAMDRETHIAVSKGELAVDPAVKDLARLTGHMFDSSTNNFFVRNGVGPELMNDILRNMTHVPEEWRFPTMVEGELIGPEQMGEIWKTWNMDNPYKALGAIHTAMTKASTDISMGARYSNRFGLDRIPVGEEGAWAKIGDIDKVDNAFLGLIDRNLFYPKQVIAELPELGRFITASRTFKNEKFQQWVNSFDEFTSALKLTQTVMKPGHHVMSVTGDFFRNRLAGVTGTQSLKDSWGIIRSRNAADKGMSELDKYAHIKDGSLAIEVNGKVNGKGTRLIIGGKPVLIDHSSMYDLYTSRGIFLPPHGAGVAEDLLAVSGAHKFDNLPGGRIANAVSKVTSKTNRIVSGSINNRFIKVNDFTSQRDNLFRGELALHAMKSKNFSSIEEALNFAEQTVRKWAPTAKDLTAMESKYNRRVFLYYTWIRGMIPRVVESMVAKPGLATLPSKGMYNLAVANGLNPASIGDPFDPNQLMPDYYTNGILGPSWKDPNSGHLWGFNPTAPVIDVFNSIGSGTTIAGINPFQDKSNIERVGRTLMGMTNPIFRSPIELTLGTNIGTNTPIQDSGQYLTDMPGPTRLASKITGHTINPALGGIPRRTEAKYKNGMSQDEWWNNAGLESLNYMTGGQVKDYTSDSAMKSAQFDQKAKAKAADTSNTRTEWWK